MMWSNFGSAAAGLMFVWAVFQQYFPPDLRRYLEKYARKLLRLGYPYVQITFPEYDCDHFMRSEAYTSIETYLSSSTSASLQAKRLTASSAKNTSSRLVVLTISEHEEVEDEFEGHKFWWVKQQDPSSSSSSPPLEDKRSFRLTFYKTHRDLVTTRYLDHVLREGMSIKQRNRQRKLYTNYGPRWSHVVFEHPATFQSIAMDASKKEDIIEDLISFSNAEDFYARIGKAWKRGYLLYGPPGTGKSTMIAAIANLLGYDVYDLELTAVRDNTELRKLLMQTTSKSLIVIEDIDCSLDLTGQRKEKKEKANEGEGKADSIKKPVMPDESENKSSRVTLSGLLNFIDGIWSACKGERLIVFTTNFKEKLDPALIRRGRMDKHIELSYCRSEAFRVLASNYWRLDDHPKFEKIGRMLEETDVTPADVAECLMPKTAAKDVEECLDSVIEAVEKAKEDAKKKKAEEEEAKKAAAEEEEEAKRKAAEEEAKEKEESTAKGEEKKENGWLGNKEGEKEKSSIST